MSSLDELNQCPCDKIDAHCVDAFFEYSLDINNPAEIIFSNSWVDATLDITPAVKEAETITNLLLTPTALQFNREDYGRDGALNGGIDCINGDDLSRIISMKYLKDVGGNAPTGGDVYMFNTSANQFQPYNLQTFIDQTSASITNLNNQVSELQAGLVSTNARIDAAIADYTNKINNLQAQVAALQTAFNNYQATTNNRLNAIEATIAKPSWAPNDAVLAWGNINYESAYDPTGHLIGTHTPSSQVQGDGQFK